MSLGVRHPSPPRSIDPSPRGHSKRPARADNGAVFLGLRSGGCGSLPLWPLDNIAAGVDAREANEEICMSEATVRAAALLIGDELLSGRTQDVNLKAIAEHV